MKTVEAHTAPLKSHRLRVERTGTLSLLLGVAAVTLSGSVFSSAAHAQLAVAGQLVVDLNYNDLSADATTWENTAASLISVGDFSTIGGENLNVVEDIADANYSVGKSLYISLNGDNAIASALDAPSAVLGNNSRTAEAWIYSQSLGGTQTVVSWGNRSREQLSSFNYSGGGNGMVSGYFNDTGWDVNPEPTGEWVHLAWTWDGSDARGYINGVLTKEADLLDFNTTASLVSVGATEETNGRDPIDGYIADIRIHTGVLNDAQLVNNFEAGPGARVGTLCDFDGDSDCDSNDFGILRDNLFTEGGASEGDWNRDGFVDLDDYRSFKDDTNRIIGVSSLASIGSPVPEPTTLGVAAIALFALGAHGGRARAA